MSLQVRWPSVTTNSCPIPVRLRSVTKPSIRAPARCEHLRTNANRTAIRTSVRARVVHIYAPPFVCVKHQRRHDQLPPFSFCGVWTAAWVSFRTLVCAVMFPGTLFVFSCCVCALISLPLALVVRPCVCGNFLSCLMCWKRSIGEWCCVRGVL